MKPILRAHLTELSQQAASRERHRLNFNYHHGPDDHMQRMLNALEPNSYVQPHRHQNPDKREAFLILTGRLAVVEFDDAGHVTQHIVLDHAAGNFGTEIAAGTWHTIFALQPATVAYELKDGPWDPADDKDFAPWAPPETQPEAAATWLANLRHQLNLKLP